MADSRLFIARQPLTGMWQPFIGDPTARGRGWWYAPIDSASSTPRETFRQSSNLRMALDWMAQHRPDLAVRKQSANVYLLD